MGPSEATDECPPPESAVSLQTSPQICISIKCPKTGLVRTVTGRAGRQRAPSVRGEGGHFSFSSSGSKKNLCCESHKGGR